MKKLLLPMLASVASIAIADAAPFNGFYAGAQFGLQKRTSTSTITQGYRKTDGTDTNSSFINFTKKDKKNGLMYGLFAGWGKVVANGFYAGAEAVLYDTNTNTQQNLSAPTLNGNTSMWPFTAKYKRGPVLGIGPRVGFVIDGTWLAFAKLGLEFSKDQITYQNIASGTINGTGGGSGYAVGPVFSSSKKLKMAFVPEIGVEKAFGAVLARIAVSYNLGAKMNQAPAAYNQATSAGNYANTETQSSKYSAIGLKLGVAYQF